jgi:hypothetical protein
VDAVADIPGVLAPRALQRRSIGAGDFEPLDLVEDVIAENAPVDVAALSARAINWSRSVAPAAASEDFFAELDCVWDAACPPEKARQNIAAKALTNSEYRNGPPAQAGQA